MDVTSCCCSDAFWHYHDNISASQENDWYDWLFLFGIQLVAIVEWGYLIIARGRFIDRAFYCATLPALFIGIWILAKYAGILNKHTVFYTLAGVMTIACLYVSGTQYLNIESSKRAQAASPISFDADKIYSTHPDNLYVYDDSIIGGTALFLNMDYRGCYRNCMMWGGTGVFSKPFYEKIGRFGYEEFYSNNLFDENVYYITTDSDVWNSTFMAYMKKTYGDTVYADVEECTDSGVFVYKFHKG